METLEYLLGLMAMNIVEEYSFGRIRIAGREYFRDVIVFPDEVIKDWWRKEGHNLCMEDLREVLKRKPEIIVIGNGYAGVMRVPESVVEKLEGMGIQVIVRRTREAVEIYNRLAKEGKRVAAALHLTC